MNSGVKIFLRTPKKKNKKCTYIFWKVKLVPGSLKMIFCCFLANNLSTILIFKTCNNFILKGWCSWLLFRCRVLKDFARYSRFVHFIQMKSISLKLPQLNVFVRTMIKWSLGSSHVTLLFYFLFF